MALTKYTYSKDANITVLTDEVLADAGITTALNHIDLIDDADPDTVDIWFVDAISGAEETVLDAVVAAHANPAVPTAFICHTGAGAPDSYLGVDGDICVDPDTMVLYKKTAGAWGAAKSIDGGGGSVESDVQSSGSESDTNTTSGSWVDLDSCSVTTSNTQALDYIVSFSAGFENTGVASLSHFRIVADGVEVPYTHRHIEPGNASPKSVVIVAKTNQITGKVIKVQYHISSGTLTVHERSLVVRGLA